MVCLVICIITTIGDKKSSVVCIFVLLSSASVSQTEKLLQLSLLFAVIHERRWEIEIHSKNGWTVTVRHDDKSDDNKLGKKLSLK